MAVLRNVQPPIIDPLHYASEAVHLNIMVYYINTSEIPGFVLLNNK